MPLAIFGIENSTINLGVTLLALALVAIWIALIVFTFSDARRRISDPFLIGCATAASFFPYVGTIVYTILRPPEFLEDVNERETEMRASETRLRHLAAHSCPKCGFPAEADFVRCPACRSRLKEPCPSCQRPVGLKWKVCPYCEHTLIERKRSRGAKAAEKRPEGRKRSRDRQEDRREAQSPSSAEGAERGPAEPIASGDGAESGRGRRSGRRVARSDTAAPADSGDRNEPAETAGKGRTEASRRSGSDERPPRRASRRRTVVPDEESPPDRTINGGDSDGPGGRAD
jgi:hypothetical protein